MNNFKQEWFIDFAPCRRSPTLLSWQNEDAADQLSSTGTPESEPLTAHDLKTTVKA
jgi:hypothetical protein